MSFWSLCFFLMKRRPPTSTRTNTLFPYTTLFRSFSLGVDTESELVAYATAVIAGNGPVIRISDAADQPRCLDSGVQRKLAAARRQLVLIYKHVEAQCLGLHGVVDDVQAHVVCAIAGRNIEEVVRSGMETPPTHQWTSEIG